jgi:hypothetical protein
MFHNFGISLAIRLENKAMLGKLRFSFRLSPIALELMLGSAITFPQNQKLT